MFIRGLFIFLFCSLSLFSVEAKDPWVLLIKQYDQERVTLRFFDDPSLKILDKKKTTVFASENEGAKQMLKMQQRENREKREIFDAVLAKINQNKELALIETKEKDKTNKTYLDTKVLTNDNLLIETRTFLTKDHIYTMESSQQAGLASSHKTFVNSFKIFS